MSESRKNQGSKKGVGGDIGRWLVWLAFVLAMVLTLAIQWVEAAEIRVMWNANVEEYLAGYRIYYGKAARSGLDPAVCQMCGYEGVIQVGVWPTRAVVENLDLGVTYWLSATAFGTGDYGESAFSNEAVGVAHEAVLPIPPMYLKVED